MSRLLFILSDLYPVRLSEAASASLPRLPALERWLGRGLADTATGGWRRTLQREWQGGAVGAVAPASIAGAAVAEARPDQPLWFATPVHFVAGLATLRLHPGGLLTLGPDEQRILEADFARVFAGSGWTLHATGRREMLLAGGAAGRVHSLDPAWSLGADPSAGLPAGEGAAPLRRLGAEVEMWLHEHPVNQVRLSRGLLNANALWIWGGGEPLATMPAASGVSAARAPPMAWADDLFVDGLARLTGTIVNRPPERWPAEAASARGDLLCVCELGAAPDTRSLRALDEDWIAPALELWRRGAYQSATLLAGRRAIRLERGSLRQFGRALRPARPWWENLLQC